MLEDILEQIHNIHESILTVQKRFSSIKTPLDFVSSETGTLLLDSICMRLQSIGEQIKSIDKHYKTFFEKYPEINWNDIIRLRDLISHHYNDIDYEEIYLICSSELPPLLTVIEKIIKEN